MANEAESSMATRPSLLARLKDWNQETAWREFEHNYTPLLRNVARKAGLTDVEADEVAQEVLFAVAKKIGEFKHAGNRGAFRAWLYQQARWRIVDQFRKRPKATAGGREGVANNQGNDDTGTVVIGEFTSAAPPELEKIWDDEWRERVQQLAIARLKRRVSARQFQLFDLHVFQGLSVREAAAIAGSTMAAVYMANSRVGRLFKRELKLAADDAA